MFPFATFSPLHASTFSGALAYHNTDRTTQNFTTASALSFGSETYDYGNWHDTSVNTSRLTVPSGVSAVRVTAQVGLSLLASNDLVTVEIRKNGVSTTPTFISADSMLTRTDLCLSVFCPYNAVTAGDYFEVWVKTTADTSVTLVANKTYLHAEKVA